MRRIIFISLLVLTTLPAIGFSAELLPSPSASRYTHTEHKLYPVMSGDSVKGHHITTLHEADKNAALAHSYEPIAEKGSDHLPMPEALPQAVRRLSLKDAIALALRNNPTVKISELQRILDKFGLETVLRQAQIQWAPLTVSTTLQNHVVPQWRTGTGVKLNVPTGTSISVGNTSTIGGPGVTSLSVTQHLLKGSGLTFNRVPYQNAYDSEKIARYNFKNNIIGVVTNVITNYRALVQAYNSLDADKKSFANQEQDYVQDQLQVKAGVMAPADLLQQKENLESTQLSLVQEQNTLMQTYQNFLISLGLVPSAKYQIDRAIHVRNIKVPDLKTCITLALAHNIAYRQALINLRMIKRALIVAKNARKWTLDATGSVQSGNLAFTPTGTTTPTPNVALNLSIPLDNFSGKAGVVTAQENIETAKLNLAQTKQALISTVMTQLTTIHNQYAQIRVAELAEQLQRKSLANAQLRLKYGRATMFEVNEMQTTLLTQQVNLIATKIAYLNAITALHQTLGMTLHHWHIKLRY